ncbi:MAG: SH3 domain-containing protein, partial [Candidatus Pacebacteria bacterium]|nr:SH3 domain-containing protein [Candidatus Paceibacterota bacterium]
VLPASTVASIKIAFDWLRVRKDDTTESSILGMVYEGESYEVLDKKNGWYKIKSKIGTGWVSGVYVQEL